MDIASIIQSLSASPTQHARLLRLHTPLGPQVLVAEALDGWESLDDGGFHLQLTALSPSAHLDLNALLGQPVLLQLLTAQSLTRLRPFHAHVTAFEHLGSNGGLARYRLILQPWLAALQRRQDSYIFADMTVMDIVENVFADYQGQGALAPAWRWDLADRSIYAKRSLTTQYQESDFAFVSRLLAEEGIFYWFEHTGDVSAPTLGSHTLVLADHTSAFTPTDGDGACIRFHRADATERSDTIQYWQIHRAWPVTDVKRASWDYRSLSMRPAEASSAAIGNLPLTDDDTAGPYAWHSTAEGARRAQQQLEALQTQADSIEGGGAVRTLAPGQRFVLDGHPSYPRLDAARFLCRRVHHHARNNLSADVHAYAEQQLGAATQHLTLSHDLASMTPGLDAAAAHSTPDGSASTQPEPPDTDFYHNRFAAQPAQRPYRPHTTDGHGQRRHPKPSVHGTQSAIVVGVDDPLHSDRDHRIKVQMHWQRGSNAGSGQAHPGGEDNAPGKAGPGTWVRVLAPLAGANFGAVQLPRVGQEVAVDFLEGDIDRPVVIASLYNGKGHADAPHNQVAGGRAGATGNAAAWFAGNDHPAVFTGSKTQSLAASQSGSGGYNLLRFDHTPGQGRIQLGTTQHASALNLGVHRAGNDNVRAQPRGFGAELATQASGAVRAGAGLLLSTEEGAQQMSAAGPAASLDQAHSLHASLADVAKAQGADLPTTSTASSDNSANADAPTPSPNTELPASAALKTTAGHVTGSIAGHVAATGIGGGEGEADAFGKPVIAAHGDAGLSALTPNDHIWVSGTQTSLSSAGALSLIAQGATAIAAAGGISLFTQGTLANPRSPDTTTGIALAAASGPVSVQAQAKGATFSAEKNITLASTEADIAVAAKTHLLATAAGAYIKLDGGNIELGAPGKINFKAAKKELTGGESVSAPQVTLNKSTLDACQQAAGSADASNAALMGIG